jgi:hypothetical protein
MTPTRQGGCQCGAIRFAASGASSSVSLCHCRMCQKASGNLFGAFATYPRDAVTWSAPPARFRSSSIAERGFCARCGTPLSWEGDGKATVSLALGAFDDPGSLPPTKNIGVEGRLPWLAEAIRGQLPETVTKVDAAMEDRRRGG